MALTSPPAQFLQLLKRLPWPPSLLYPVSFSFCCSGAIYSALSCLAGVVPPYIPRYWRFPLEEGELSVLLHTAILDLRSPTKASIVTMFQAELEALGVLRFKSRFPFFLALKF